MAASDNLVEEGWLVDTMVFVLKVEALEMRVVDQRVVADTAEGEQGMTDRLAAAYLESDIPG